jgi:hypothetical protein
MIKLIAGAFFFEGATKGNDGKEKRSAQQISSGGRKGLRCSEPDSEALGLLVTAKAGELSDSAGSGLDFRTENASGSVKVISYFESGLSRKAARMSVGTRLTANGKSLEEVP